MRKVKKALLTLAVAVTTFGTLAIYKPVLAANKKPNVLFIGNSKTYYCSVPQMTRNILNNKKEGVELKWDAIVFGGKSLEEQADYLKRAYEHKDTHINGANSCTDNELKPYCLKIEEIKRTKYDIVVIQEKTSVAQKKYDWDNDGVDTENHYKEGATQILKLLKSNGKLANHPSVIVYDAWANYENSGNTNLDLNEKHFYLMKTMYDNNIQISINAKAVAKKIKKMDGFRDTLVVVADTASAFNKYIFQENEVKENNMNLFMAPTELFVIEKKVKNPKNYNDYECRHANENGAYLASCVLSHAIYFTSSDDQKGFLFNDTVKKQVKPYKGFVKRLCYTLDFEHYENNKNDLEKYTKYCTPNYLEGSDKGKKDPVEEHMRDKLMDTSNYCTKKY